MKLLHVKFGNNSLKHVILSKPIFYDISQTQSENIDIYKKNQEQTCLITYVENTLDRHPNIDKIFQMFLRYIFGWFSMVTYYLE